MFGRIATLGILGLWVCWATWASFRAADVISLSAYHKGLVALSFGLVGVLGSVFALALGFAYASGRKVGALIEAEAGQRLLSDLGPIRSRPRTEHIATARPQGERVMAGMEGQVATHERVE